MTATVQFKTKIKYIYVNDTEKKPVVDYKRKVNRIDCNLRPHQHTYYNSDLFPSMLQRAYEKVTGGRDWSYLDCLPEGVQVDDSKFMAIVTVNLPESFK